MNILIIDDQSDARRELIEMVESAEPGMHSFTECDNGADALICLSESDFGLIFLDMNMPVLDGRAFLQTYTAARYRSVLVVLSAYDDFSYMQTAVRYHAAHYLLKPIHALELFEVLRLARNQIGEPADLDGASSERIIRRLMREYLTGQDARLNADNLFRYVKGWRQSGSLAVLACACDMEQAVTDLLHAFGALQYGYTAEETWVAVLTRVDDWDALRAALSGLRPESFFTMSDPVSRYDDLPSAYRQAERIQSRGQGMAEDDDSLLLDVYGAIHARDEDALNQAAAALVRLGARTGSTPENPRAHLIRNAQRLAALFARQYGDLFADECLHWRAMLARLEEDTANLSNSYDMKVRFRDCLNGFREAFCRVSPDDQSGQTVLAIVRVIASRYREPISVTRVANELSMNYAYVSNLFSTRMGVTMTAYINRRRLDAACALLTTGTDKIHAIGRAVGFYDSKTFLKAFKKEYGITPTEYRMRAQCGGSAQQK